MTKLKVPFRKFANASKKILMSDIGLHCDAGITKMVQSTTTYTNNKNCFVFLTLLRNAAWDKQQTGCSKATDTEGLRNK
jgi:glucosamine 6-phosphate synthetase-like amidotransferase/phosphosugar isomerase protein